MPIFEDCTDPPCGEAHADGLGTAARVGVSIATVDASQRDAITNAVEGAGLVHGLVGQQDPVAGRCYGPVPE